jgi:O-antigen/teichoic acid export membrane protein
MHRLLDLYNRLRDNEKIVLLGTLWTTVIRVLGMGISYLSLILFARWMGEEQFGIYSYVFAAITTLAIVPLYGFSYASIPFIAEYEANKTFDKIRGLLLFSTGFVVIASIVVSLVFAVLVSQDIVGFGEYKNAIVAGCVALPVFSLLSYMGGVSRGLGRVIAAFAPLQVLMPFLFLLLAFLSFYYLNGLDSRRAIWLWFLSMLLIAVAQSLYIYRVVRRRFPGSSRSYEVGHWIRKSSHFLLISIAIAVLFQMDILILGIFLEPEFVGYYSATARTALLVTMVLQSINSLGARQYATLYNRHDIDELQKLLHSISRWIIWATVGISAFLILTGHFVLSIFGENFTQAYPSLVILTLAHAFAAILGPVTALLNVTGNQEVTAKILTIAILIGVVLNSVLIPAYGMVGAAIATGGTTIYWAFSLHGKVRKILGVETCLFLMRT